MRPCDGGSERTRERYPAPGFTSMSRIPEKTPPASGGSGGRMELIQASWALDISVRAVKAALSLTASSASILRLISTPAFFRPFMKVE